MQRTHSPHWGPDFRTEDTSLPSRSEIWKTYHSSLSNTLGGSLLSTPAPYPWAPTFLPEQWAYTDGSDITGHARLGAAVVHIPTSITIYIDVAEMVAIHTALTTFSAHE